MESYCIHRNINNFEDETLLLDDENTNINNRCNLCNKRSSVENNSNAIVNIEGTNFIQNRNGTLIGIIPNSRLSISNEHLDSPEDSPLLNGERCSEFGNLSIGEFHCHTNYINEHDNKALKQLVTVSMLCFLFMIAELIGGYVAGSLAVMTDAAHLISDLVGFVISIMSIYISKRSPTRSMTYGYHRAEILGAFLSVLVIWILAGTFFILAIGRLLKDEYNIDADTMLLISSFGLVINIVMATVLHGMCHQHSHGLSNHSHEENINIRAATAHILGDILQSVGVLFAAIIIKISPNAKEADPICTILFSVVVVGATLKVARDSFLILLQSSPVNVGDLIYTLRNIHGVKHVHGVHLWQLATDRNVFSAHLAVDDYCDRDIVLNQATHIINKRLNLITCHIQIEAFNQQLINSCMKCQELQC